MSEHRSEHYTRKALPKGIVRRLLKGPRNRMYKRFEHHFPATPELRVLNVGCNATHKEPSLYFLESRYPYLSQVTACGLEEGDNVARFFPEATYVRVRRGEPLPFADNEFDVVFCNAVVEHVGDRHAQREFVADVVRVARGGFLTTPNRWYPVETHTALPLIHFLPARGYREIYRKLGFEFFAEEENLNLLARRDFQNLFPPTVRPRLKLESLRFFGLRSNFMAVWKK